MKLDIVELAKKLFSSNKTYCAVNGVVNKISEPKLLQELTPSAYLSDLSNRLDASAEMTQTGAFAVAGANTVVTLAAPAFAIGVKFITKKLDAIWPFVKMAIAYTDSDGTSIARDVYCDPDGEGNFELFILLLKVTGGNRQISYLKTGNLTLTVLADTIPVGTYIGVRSYVKQDLDELKARIGARSVNVPSTN